MRKLLKVGTILLAVAAGAVGAVVLTDDDPLEVIQLQSQPSEPTPRADDDDRPLAPDEEDRASRAALRVTGGGEVVEFDRSDDPGEAYEIEVFKDGREYDVALDAAFRPVPNRRYED